MSEQPAGNAAPAPTPGPEGKADESAQQFVTRADLEQLLKTELGEDKIRSIAQSQVARQTRRIQEGVQQITDLLKESGVEMTPADLQRIQDQYALREAARDLNPTQATGPAQQPGQEAGKGPGQPDETAYQQQVQAEGAKILQRLGVEYSDADPEAAVFQQPWAQESEAGYYAAVAQYGVAKAQRLGQQPPAGNDAGAPTPPPDPNRAAARSPGLGAAGSPASNPIENINNPTELLRRWEESGGHVPRLDDNR